MCVLQFVYKFDAIAHWIITHCTALKVKTSSYFVDQLSLCYFVWSFWFEWEHSNEIGTTIEKFKNIGEKIGKYSKISENIRKYRKIFENIGKNRKLFEKIVCHLAPNRNSSKCLSQNSFVFIMKFLGLLVLVFGCAVAFPRAKPSCECGK